MFPTSRRPQSFPKSEFPILKEDRAWMTFDRTAPLSATWIAAGILCGPRLCQALCLGPLRRRSFHPLAKAALGVPGGIGHDGRPAPGCRGHDREPVREAGAVRGPLGSAADSGAGEIQRGSLFHRNAFIVLQTEADKEVDISLTRKTASFYVSCHKNNGRLEWWRSREGEA
jgi:hypothetical protein